MEINDRRLNDLWQRHNALGIKLAVVSPKYADMSLSEARNLRMQLQRIVGTSIIQPIAHNAIYVNSGVKIPSYEMQAALRSLIRSNCSADVSDMFLSRTLSLRPITTTKYRDNEITNMETIYMSRNRQYGSYPNDSPERSKAPYRTYYHNHYATDSSQLDLSLLSLPNANVYQTETPASNMYNATNDPPLEYAVRPSLRQAIDFLNAGEDESVTASLSPQSSLSFNSEILDFNEYKARAKSMTSPQQLEYYYPNTKISQQRQCRYNQPFRSFSCARDSVEAPERRCISVQYTKYLPSCYSAAYRSKINAIYYFYQNTSDTTKQSVTPDIFPVYPSEQRSVSASQRSSFVEYSIYRSRTFGSSYNAFRKLVGEPSFALNYEIPIGPGETPSRLSEQKTYYNSSSSPEYTTACINLRQRYESPVLNNYTQYSSFATMSYLKMSDVYNPDDQPSSTYFPAKPPTTMSIRYSLTLVSPPTSYGLHHDNYLEISEDTPLPPSRSDFPAYLSEPPIGYPTASLEIKHEVYLPVKRHSIRYPSYQSNTVIIENYSKLPRKRRTSAEFIAQYALLERVEAFSMMSTSGIAEETTNQALNSTTNLPLRSSVMELESYSYSCSPNSIEEYSVKEVIAQMTIKRPAADLAIPGAEEKPIVNSIPSIAQDKTHPIIIQNVSLQHPKRQKYAVYSSPKYLSQGISRNIIAANQYQGYLVEIKHQYVKPQSGLLDFSKKLYNYQRVDDIISDCEKDKWSISGRMAGYMMRSYYSLLGK